MGEDSGRKIPLMRPRLSEAVRQRVQGVLESGHWTEGPLTRELESRMRDYVGCGHAIAVTSCTTGLEIALRALGVGPGDEVIVPDYTYPATAAVVRIVGASLVIVDVDPATMLVDYDALEEAVTPRTKALIPVSLFGNPLDHARLAGIEERHGVHVVEDAACSIGAALGDRRVGDLADISVFSLHPRKFITTGEGGIVTTNDPALADWMRSYKHFGGGYRDGVPTGVFERIGTNYKLSDIQAAVGVAQMEEIDALLERRIELSERYLKLLSGCGAVTPQETTPGGLHSRQSFCIRVPERDRVMAELRADGVEVQIGSYALHGQPAFAEGECCSWRGSLAGSQACFDEALVLPLYHDMEPATQERVVAELLARLPAGGR